MPEINFQGAEAKIYEDTYNRQVCLVKERFVKNYRLPELDKTLTKSRMKAEQKAIKRCEDAGIIVPKIFNVDFNNRKIYMQLFRNAVTVKEHIFKIQKNEDFQQKIADLSEKVGKIIGKLHASNLIHGDLTTSNILIEEDTGELIMIDFGLSCYSASHEDKGVDLYVLERALISTHSTVPELFDAILESYKKVNPTASETVKKFEEVRARGRKRTMIG